MTLPIEVDDRPLVSFVLNRRGRDFSDRECELLDLIGVRLSRLCRNARVGSRERSVSAPRDQAPREEPPTALRRPDRMRLRSARSPCR